MAQAKKVNDQVTVRIPTGPMSQEEQERFIADLLTRCFSRPSCISTPREAAEVFEEFVFEDDGKKGRIIPKEKWYH